MKPLLTFAILLQVFAATCREIPDTVFCDSIEIKFFNELQVSASVEVILVNSKTHFAYIKGTAALISTVQIKQMGSRLIITRKGWSSMKGKVFVYLPSNKMRYIEATEGAKVNSYDPVRGDTLILSAASEGVISITIDANIVKTISGQNGDVGLSGTCDYSFRQSDENGISFIEFRKQGYKENFWSR